MKGFLHGFEGKYQLVIRDQPDTKLWGLLHPPESILRHYEIVDPCRVKIAEFLAFRYDNGLLGLDMKTHYENASEFPKSYVGDDFLDRLVAHIDPKQRYRPLESKIYDPASEKTVHIDYLKTNITLFIEWLVIQSFGADFPLSIHGAPEFDGSRFRFVKLEGHEGGIQNAMTIHYPGEFTPVGETASVLTRPVVSFRLQQLAPERLSARALCHPSPQLVREQFDSLLDRIHRTWPEAISDMERTTVISILFLSADPTNASRLRLGEELREIQEKLQLAKLRDHFRLDQRMSVRPADISQAMLDIEPQIVHFSGHGTATGELCFENQVGETHPIQPEALAALFEQFADRVSCVVLNACYSENQANAIARHIDYVIGMNQAIDDKAAIAFAIGFYQALGAGRTVEEAYELGRAQIRLQSIPEHLTPVLIKKG